MAVVFECPVCEFQGKVADDQQGKEIACKGCGHKFPVPARNGKSSPKVASAVATPPAAKNEPPVIVQCPNCKVAGKVPASVRGKKIKCPKCSQAFVVPGGSSPALVSNGPAARLSDEDEAAPEPDHPDGATNGKALDDVGLAPLEGAEVAEEQSAKPEEVYDLVDDNAIVVETVCPKCKHKGTVPEKFAGKKVKCPRCSVPFVVGGAAVAAKAEAKKAAPAASAAGEANPFAALNGDDQPAKAAPKPAVATVNAKRAPAAGDTAVIAAEDNPFAFEEGSAPAAPSASRKVAGDDKTAPRPARAKSQDDDDEPKRDNTLLWFGAGGVALVVLLGGGLLALVNMNTKAAPKEVAVVAPNPDKEPDTLPPPTIAEKNTKAAAEKKKVDRTIPDKRPNGIAAPQPKDKPPPDVADPMAKAPAPLVEANTGPAVEAPPEKKPDVPPPLPVGKDVVWIDASSDSAKLQDVRVRITAVWLDFVKGPAGVSPKKFLLVQLQIENQNPDKEAGYRGWSVTERNAGKAAPAQLADDKGKAYRIATRHDTIVKPAGQIDKEFIKPSQTLDDLLVFEPVHDKVEFLRLALPAANLGGEGMLGFQIPGAMLVAKMNPKEPMAKDGAGRLKGLIDKMKTGPRASREAAIIQIADLKESAAPAVPELIAVLQKDKDEFVRAAAAEALGKIGPPARIAINTLISALRDEFWKVKANACEALGTFGPDAKEAIPQLKKLMTSKEEEVPTKAAAALSKIDAKGRPAPPKKK